MSHHRIKVHFSGDVQGVGFRYTARQVAAGLSVVGYVKNLSDGRVLLVAEGAPSDTQAFLQAVVDRMRENISNHTIEISPATGEFGKPGVDAFVIR